MPTLSQEDITIHLPEIGGDLDQDEEYFEIERNGTRERVRFHDYDEIYKVPGLYEKLFAERLQCDSPKVVVDLLEDTLAAEGEDPEELVVVDLGAGNGMVGEELARIGADQIVGIDMIEEAKDAALRDRPEVYDAYHATDITDPGPPTEQDLEQRNFNCLTCVAALGFGDMPPEAFQAAYDLVGPEGWVAFNIRDQFIDRDDPSGFRTLINGLAAENELEICERTRYPHRLSMSGEPIEYVAVVGRKAA